MIDLVYSYFTPLPTADGRWVEFGSYVSNLKQAYEVIGFDARVTNPYDGLLKVELSKKEVKENEELHDCSKD